jgi:hypothetical protein
MKKTDSHTKNLHCVAKSPISFPNLKNLQGLLNPKPTGKGREVHATHKR